MATKKTTGSRKRREKKNIERGAHTFVSLSVFYFLSNPALLIQGQPLPDLQR